MDIRTKVGSSNFIKAADLAGKPSLLTIHQCVEEVVGQGRYRQGRLLLTTAAGDC